MKAKVKHINSSLIILSTSILLCLYPAQSFSQKNSPQAADSLKILIKNEKDVQKKQWLLTELTDVYEYQGNWKEYDKVIQQMIKLAESLKDSLSLAEAYNRLGISSCYRGENNDALHYFRLALEINCKYHDSLSMANCYENIGLAYRDLCDYTNSIEYQIKSIEIRKAYDHSRIFNNYIEMAVLQRYIRNIKKQDEYIQLAKNELNKRSNIGPSDQAIFYNELGDIYDDREMYDSCIICYKKVIELSRLINWKVGIAVGLGNLAEVYYETGLTDSAIAIHKESLALSLAADDCMSISEEYIFLARLYQEIGEHDSIVIYAENALKKAEECKLLHDQAQALEFLAGYYESLENYEKAYKYVIRNFEISDSIFSSDVKNNIAELETKYQTKVKEQKIKLLTSENQIINQRIALFITITIALLLAIISVLLFYVRRKRQNIQREEILRHQLLRTQMNPHFLFNALGSIQNFMYKNEAKKAAGYLNNFASLTRAILEYSDQEFIPLSEEIETLKNYLELEQMRANYSFEYSIQYSEEFDTEFTFVPPMFIQPFAENSIKHGFKNIQYKAILKIELIEQDNLLNIIISDNGCGINSTVKESEHQSKSMQIFDERRSLIARRMKKDIYFAVEDKNKSGSNESGTVVTIKLPIGK